jgi:hypothetical protein
LIFNLPSYTSEINIGGSNRVNQNTFNFNLDDDEVNDVKKLITATLILVIITLVLMAVAIVYVVRSLAIS